MTQLLISVKNVEEAGIALAGGADIIDLKNPDEGALGALPIAEIQSILAFINGRKEVSATIGDIPMQADLIVGQVAQLQKLPLSFIKIGFFATGNYQVCLDAIQKLESQSINVKNQQLIAVLFAELDYPIDLLAKIKQAGFSGVMLDTMHKNGKTYQDYYPVRALNELLAQVTANQLLFGIAGSLQISHVKSAKKLMPYFMGFRGGVCAENKRQSSLDMQKIYNVREFLH